MTWRNATTSTNYLDHLTTFSAPNGYRVVKPGDQTFVNRQDLIRYGQLHDIVDALPYLTTFTREFNSPSWTPRDNAVDLGGNNGSGSIYAYKDRAEFQGAINRNLANVRDFQGKPLISKRFPLMRLAMLEDPSASASDIQEHFGLSGSATGGWTYNHGNGSRILTLEEVAAAGREPDFFELLKAAILRGSLGSDPGHNSALTLTGGPVSNPSAYRRGNSGVLDLNAYQDDHIIQIGANIIDQWDAGNFPTTITFNGRAFHGMENLPYMTRAFVYCYEETRGEIGTWIRPELWRPYQDPNSTSDAHASPEQVRIQVFGRSYATWRYTTGTNTLPRISGQPVDFDANPSIGQLYFSPDSIAYDHPTALSSSFGVTSPNSENIKSSWPGSPAMVFTGHVPFLPDDPARASAGIGVAVQLDSSLTFALQWLDGSTWRTYALMENIVVPLGNEIKASATSASGKNTEPYTYYARVDPRSDRFGMSAYWYPANPAAGYALDKSIRPDSGDGFGLRFGWPNSPAFRYNPQPGNNLFHLGVLSDNIVGKAAYYSDVDGVVRPAAGAYTSGAGADGFPLIPSSSATDNQHGRRPVILNRPFQSVAEIGYAFRDLPFKELDFFTTESADGGLLDVFTIYDEPEMVAGRVSPNTPHPEVLQAILAGGTRREHVGHFLSETDAQSLADCIVKHTADANKGPLMNRADLVTRVSDDLTSALSTPGDQRNKTQREAIGRSLAGICNTRTWNLMIDVIAQAGQYPRGANSLDDFVVEGERRYWLHVAIDRYTGKIIDQHYEAVTE